MILTKDHTPTGLALGTTNSISELAQMAGIVVGSPFIRCVWCIAFFIGLNECCTALCLPSRSRPRFSMATFGSSSYVFSPSLATSPPVASPSIGSNRSSITLLAHGPKPVSAVFRRPLEPQYPIAINLRIDPASTSMYKIPHYLLASNRDAHNWHAQGTNISVERSL